MLSKGDHAPDFVFTDDDGRKTSLRESLAGGPVVLYFYPADFTPICTRQACMMRDMHSELVEKGIRVLGISPQDEESHRKFKAAHHLPFTLVADPKREIVRAYKAGGLFGLPLPFGARRITYLISTDGKIADAVSGEFGTGPHERFVRAAIGG
ncbi:MAG: peroxiredoxin [Planctomycetes bacterium]|nr:peroxiredoxin [Planctomycetota bacterium]